EHADAGGAQDREPDLGPHPVDLDELLEQLQFLRGGEAEERELVLADVGVDVQLDLAAGRPHPLARGGRDAEQVADPARLDHDLVGGGADPAAPEVADHLAARSMARRRRLRAWQSAIASASAECSSRREVARTWRASMRAIRALSAMP